MFIYRTMIATSFSPNEARKAFPCFDEPELKATFDITIRHPLKSYAISNTPQLVSSLFVFMSNGILTFYYFRARRTKMTHLVNTMKQFFKRLEK